MLFRSAARLARMLQHNTVRTAHVGINPSLRHASARNLSSVANPYPSLHFLEDHSRSPSSLLRKSLTQFQARGIRGALFEGPYNIDVREDSVNVKELLQENFDFFLKNGVLDNLREYCLQKYPNESVTDNLALESVLHNLSLINYEEGQAIISFSFPEINKEACSALASMLLTMTSLQDSSKLMSTAVEVFGEQYCLNIDLDEEFLIQNKILPNSRGGMEVRGKMMALAMSKTPYPVVSLNGVEHFRFLTKNFGSYKRDSEADGSLSGESLSNRLFIFPQMTDREVYEYPDEIEGFKFHRFDASKMSPQDLVSQIDGLVESHFKDMSNPGPVHSR